MNYSGIVGHVLDGKYSIEKLLGKGGMGSVYLATHIGTARPVAVKVITPEFMRRAEFVERFRREAKAAGRLRHPNVVDVTDFGFSTNEAGESAAYLVMEYLDGCTLGEVLDEEKQLPISFSIDILEQVCSAVEEAHKQGIIHRDLKPDNIWLEPNQRGGYTVKVLDFGIAKLEEMGQDSSAQEPAEISDPNEKGGSPGNETVVISEDAETFVDPRASTRALEGETIAHNDGAKTIASEVGTMIQEGNPSSLKPIIDSEGGTAILEPDPSEQAGSEKGTRVISHGSSTTGGSLLNSPTTSNLTRVGAVLGTPLYMSPEQCRGDKLTNRSDIYSLAVIAYQMLSGNLPFSGDYLEVMEGHKNEVPPPLIAKKAPKRLKEIVMQSLAKDPKDRPETAEAFASKMRANSEGLGILLRRALVIYSEKLPKLLQLTFLTFLPLIVWTALKVGFGLAVGFGIGASDSVLGVVSVLFEIVHFFLSIITSAFLVGMMTWVVAQYLAFPLRPISLRPAFKEVRKRAKTLSLTVGLSTILSFIGYAFCFIPGIFLSARWMLIAPSIMMEDIGGKAGFKRSVELTKRSFRTVFATAVLVYVIPLIMGISIGGFIVLANTSFVQTLRVTEMKEKMAKMKKEGVKAQPELKNDKKDSDLNVSIGPKGVSVDTESDSGAKDSPEITSRTRKFGAVTQAISQFILLPLIIILASFTSVITALIYFKTRQAGGESMQDLLGKLDRTDEPQSKWQARVRERLIQSGKVSGTGSRLT
ncbi:MAG: protein kinase [Acidobacteria bacterium]|nr:protein kinase [Acidobacteriota bacterium]